MSEARRILIIEDNATNMKLVSDMLTRAGHAVLEAINADEGIVMARDNLPDLVLMDIQLPGTDGITATRLLKKDAKTAHIPVVALTAHAMEGDAQRILDAGCDAYISKPIRYREFLQQIADILGR